MGMGEPFWRCSRSLLRRVAGVGLVTGIVSDVQALTGDARDPCRNWYDPFATNTSR